MAADRVIRWPTAGTRDTLATIREHAASLGGCALVLTEERYTCGTSSNAATSSSKAATGQARHPDWLSPSTSAGGASRV
jgi:hypothetical protein